jgi:DNA-binding NarL/FixJ family response regulator
MIVDDDLLIQKYYSVLVEWAGFEVCGLAREARDAIEKALALEPDVILMDVRLAGGMDGVDAAVEIRDRLNTKVIFITGSTEPSTLARIQADGPAAILIKPVTPDALRDTLHAQSREAN